jgi:hypothetical protein
LVCRAFPESRLYQEHDPRERAPFDGASEKCRHIETPPLRAELSATTGVQGEMQPPRTPDLDAQRTAMKKLGFLAGMWEGQARVLRGPGAMVDLAQTEIAEYKLDGLILTIEGIGKTKDGNAALQAYGILSFDDENGTYRMRAFNDGRFLESEVTLLDGESGMRWGFTLGDFKTNSVLRINEKGEWTEHAELLIGSQPPLNLIELSVRKIG